MKEDTARQLIKLNRDFYNRFADDFATSRRRLQPGIERAFSLLKPTGSLLDVGCGSGRIGFSLAELAGSVTRYLGVDFSVDLLGREGKAQANISFAQVELTSPDWLDAVAGPFDHAIALSVLHHIPGADRRLRLLQEIAGVLKPGGGLILSLWQVQHVQRLAAKLRPWSEIGLPAEALGANDLLMTWGQGDAGRRYVYEFTEAEARELCQTAGLSVESTFRSDGATGDMGLYLVCRK